MARGKRMRSAQRDRGSIATFDPLSVLSPVRLDLVQDGRDFHPDSLAPDLEIDGTPTRFVVPGFTRPKWRVHRRSIWARDYYTGSIRGVQVPVGIQYETPFRVITCIRRKIRRQVMFAKRKVGMGSRAKFRRRNSRSGVQC